MPVRTFEIIARGRLSAGLVAAFEGCWATRCERGLTHFVGCVPDQEALHRLFHQLRDLNMELVSVNRVGEDNRDFS